MLDEPPEVLAKYAFELLVKLRLLPQGARRVDATVIAIEAVLGELDEDDRHAVLQQLSVQVAPASPLALSAASRPAASRPAARISAARRSAAPAVAVAIPASATPAYSLSSSATAVPTLVTWDLPTGCKFLVLKCVNGIGGVVWPCGCSGKSWG